MRQYADGDTLAFAELFARYSRKLLSFLRTRLGTKKAHLVEEIYQKTWLKIHTGRKRYDSQYKFSTWFYTIALNTLRDEVSTKYEKTDFTEIDEQVASVEDGAEAKLILNDQMREYESALELLSPSQKTALILSDQEDLSSKEIADVMGIKDALARKLISRARLSVRQNLKEKQA